MAPPNQIETPLQLDGKTLEGGGQLVRVAIALAAITREAVSIYDIRGNRSRGAKTKASNNNVNGKLKSKKPKENDGTGLRPSHAAAVNFLADVSDSVVFGGHVGSQKLAFIPRERSSSVARTATMNTSITKDKGKGGHGTRDECACPPIRRRKEYAIHLPTAGSVFLVFQAVYPYLCSVIMGMHYDIPDGEYDADRDPSSRSRSRTYPPRPKGWNKCYIFTILRLHGAGTFTKFPMARTTTNDDTSEEKGMVNWSC